MKKSVTHDHMDAIAGIDDLRDFQKSGTEVPMQVYTDEKTANTLKNKFDYLFLNDSVERKTTKLLLNKIEINKEVILEDIKVLPLKLIHGGEYVKKKIVNFYLEFF